MQSVKQVVVKPGPAGRLRYVVSNGDQIERGTAEDILRSIKEHMRGDSTVKQMDLSQYARVLIEDAPYFLPAKSLQFLEDQAYPSPYDQALVYLANMDSSQLRILSQEKA